ncbi:MAG: GNAT family N-acetyltransferase [Burkholderiales bacterium]
MSPLSEIEILPFASSSDAEWAARTMADSDPWKTLGIGYDQSLKFLSNDTRERFLAVLGKQPVGFLVLNMQGAFIGYVQLVGVAPDARGKGVGRALIEYAEDRIFGVTPNVFICVSDFNREARAFYERLGYLKIGELRDFLVAGRSELLLRKTIGPIRSSPVTAIA